MWSLLDIQAEAVHQSRLNK